MNIIVHLGYPKTATSWLQNRLFPKVQNFNKVYRKDIYFKLIKPYALSFSPEDTRSFFQNKYGDNLLLSFEGFIGTTFNFGLNGYLTKEHALRIKNVFPEAEIILFIRNQPDIIASTYYQYITGGGTYRINTFLHRKRYNRLNGLELFSFEYFEFHHTIALYKNLFRDDKVNVYLFEEFVYNAREFIQKFILNHNLKVDLKEIDFSPELQKFRRGSMWLSFICNHFTAMKMLNKYYLINIPYFFMFYKRIIRKLDTFRVFGKRLTTEQILGSKNSRYIEEYYRESNKTLIDSFGLKEIKKYRYPI